jgi:hypothetical protein
MAPPDEDASSRGSAPAAKKSAAPAAAKGKGGNFDDLEDDIPF